MHTELPKNGSRVVERVADRLRAQRRELLAEYEQCCAELRWTGDGDYADQDAVAQTHSSAADIMSHLRREIRAIEETLERLRQRRYGTCSECGRPIAANRLRAAPTARLCMNCQVGSERQVG